MNRSKKLLFTLLVVGLVGSLAAFGTYSAWVASTSNNGNSFAAGTVKIDDDSGSATALFPGITNQAPDAVTAKCIQIKYNGSLAASVKLYISSVTNGTAFNLKVERGSGLTTVDGTRSCAGFSSSSTAYDNDLGSFPGSYAASTVDGKSGGAAWSQNDIVDYKFSLKAKDDSTANAHINALSTGTFSITWEAHNN